MKTGLGFLIGLTFVLPMNIARADSMVSGGLLGVDCHEQDPDFFGTEIKEAAQQAAYLCFAMSLSGVSPGSILELCAGARNDERRSPVEADRYANTLKSGGEDQGHGASLRLTRDAKPDDEIHKALLQELVNVRKGESYARNRTAVLERLHRDLTNGRELCAEVPAFERNQTLREYDWPKVPEEPSSKVLSECREGLKTIRLARGRILDPRDEAAIALLEATPRFVDRIRGLTLHADLAHLNFLDLHHMAKQAFETLDKRVKFLVARKPPSLDQLKDFSDDDAEFANRLACRFKMKENFPIARAKNPSAESFKATVLEHFVNPYTRANKFAGAELQHMDQNALEELTYLIGSGQFQRAIWFFEDKTDSLEMREFFEKTISQKHFAKTELVAIVRNRGLGANESYRVTLPNGIQGIFKPFVRTAEENPRLRENLRGELAVNEIDKTVELRVAPVAVALFIDQREGSFQFFVTNALTPASVDLSKEMQMGEGVAHKSWQVNFLDCIALNSDRQNSLANIMITIPDHRRVAIDNGLAFTAKKGFPLEELRHPKADSSAFIPRDIGERKFLSKRLDKLIALINNKTFLLHDDQRLNQCAKLITNAVAQTFHLMIAKCGTRSDKDCNKLGVDEYENLVNEQGFLRNYKALQCGY